MQLTDFNYTLPTQLIAKTPVEPRDASKLLVLDKHTGKITDDHFYNLANYLNPGDLLVRNNTKVIPARIHGEKETGGKIEVLLTKKVAQTHATQTWECLTKPGIKPGQKVFFRSPLLSEEKDTTNKRHELVAQCTGFSKSSYSRLLEFNLTDAEFIATLEKIGNTPLPPYIADTTQESPKIREQYQTIYAKYAGSSAAPTAGLHFTKELEKKLQEKGIAIAEVTLHVGLGTFLPVKTENITEHHMHAEWFEITKQTADLINQTKRTGGRVICVGTTSARVVESVAQLHEQIQPHSGETNIFMYPGYQFRAVDGLITNFHLPESTLLMLICALVTKPNTTAEFTNFLESSVGTAYLHAIKNEYRFYSFGDGMLLL